MTPPNLGVPSTLPEAAAFYAEQGWPVFPVAPKSKRPLTPNGFKNASADRQVVADWWTQYPDANIGFVPGNAGLVVIDVDGPEGRATAQALGLYAEPTPYVVTGRDDGGEHLYFALPTGVVAIGNVTLGPGLDVRAHSGYVLLPPSVHPSGRLYRWAGDSEAFAPASLPPQREDKRTRSSTRVRGPARTTHEPIPEGQRNTALTSFAGQLRRQGYSRSDMLRALKHRNRRPWLAEPLPAEELEGIAASVARYPKGKRRRRWGFARVLP